MNRKSIQLFAAGLFAAACVAAFFFFFDFLEAGDTQPVIQDVHPSPEDMDASDLISSLEEDGYRVLSEKEFEALQSEKEDTEVRTETKVKAILQIEQGMSSSEVAISLEKLQIIEDVTVFEKKLKESGSARRIQAGFYELHSKLTEEEIIRLITS